MLVFRAWTVSDMKDAMAHLPNPQDAGDKFAEELLLFCQEFSPTTQELRRMLGVKMGPANWHKVSGRIGNTDVRRVQPNWGHPSNEPYKKEVENFTNAVKVAFPPRVDTEKIACCTQGKEEPVNGYYYRLFETFERHSGLKEPPQRGDQPGTWESVLLGYFLKGLKPEISRAVKASYIEWKNGRLTSTLMHAIHAEDQLQEKRDRKPLTMVAVQVQNNKPSIQRKVRRGVEKRQWRCYLCETNDHTVIDCTKCRRCKRDGHWSRTCPNLQSD